MTNKEYIIGLLDEDPERVLADDMTDEICIEMIKTKTDDCPVDEKGWTLCKECFKKWLSLERKEEA